MSNGSEPRVRYDGSFELVSVRQRLIELELGDRVGIRGIESGGLIEAEVGLWWGAGGTQQRRPAGKIEVGENGVDGNGIGDEGDDTHGSTTRRADERQDIIDASDEGGPSRGRTPAWGGAA